MERAELTRALIFIGSVFSIYATAGLFILEFLWRRIFNTNRMRSKLFRITRALVFGMAGTGVVCFFYGYFIEPNWLEVTHYTLPSRKVAAGAKGFRIVLLSDLHCENYPRLEPRLAERVTAEHPDLIVFTGDSLNEPGGLPLFKETMGQLARIAPTYAVRGNFDVWYWKEMDLFGGTDVRELSLSSASLTLGGVPITLWGVPVGKENMTGQMLNGVDTRGYNIFLYHYPDLVGEGVRANVDLCLAGHTHGGQVALPIYGALVTLSKYGKRFESGLYQLDNTWLYVSRGIGMEGGPVPRVRFFARPELTVIDVVPLHEPR